MSRRSKTKRLRENLLQSRVQKPSSRAAESSLAGPYATSLICVLLLLAVFLVFGQTLGHKFSNYDDNHYVYENPHVTQGLTGNSVAWAFTSDHASNWHPITWLSHQ
ncbi:MAG: hypothetical protein ACWGMZ_04785, partial [Thermoguttaceae bacterium]